MIHIALIVGSTRPNRFSEKLIPWLEEGLKSQKDCTYEILDLRDHDLPYYNQPHSPADVKNGDYAEPSARNWAALIAKADAYLVISPEYNHGYSAVLKNAFDSVYAEWNKKAIGFAAYGSVGGGRAVEQLRQVAVELQMAPIRNAVHIMAPWMLRDESGELKTSALADYEKSRDNMLSQLIWWGEALKSARQAN